MDLQESLLRAHPGQLEPEQLGEPADPRGLEGLHLLELLREVRRQDGHLAQPDLLGEPVKVVLPYFRARKIAVITLRD